ncbi:MAG: molybdopterin-guanine dinucleotide biosynthesis protein A, partial [Alphaproteobacteria bacterium]|nr:molybdopterin-guanine dinucleotide biosynthesis protein A [Alphaproteobacteria bacterium]
SQAQKLIIVSNQAGRLDTIYRVRALLATLTSSARATPIFREYKVEDTFNFFDMVKMLGFELITVSDGDTFTHQVVIK